MGAWKRARHDGARNILVRLGKAAGLREGVEVDVEVPYLFTRYRPSDIRVRIWPGGQLEAARTCISRTAARAPGRRPLGGHGL